MSSVELNYDRMNLKQLSELEYILVGDLREVLEEESNDQNRKWLLVLVEALLKTLPREFALRERGGYMREVLLLSPELDPLVQQLKEEHDSLYRELDELAEALRCSKVFQKQAGALKERLAKWSDNLSAHNHSEEMVVFQAYQQDLGGGD